MSAEKTIVTLTCHGHSFHLFTFIRSKPDSERKINQFTSAQGAIATYSSHSVPSGIANLLGSNRDQSLARLQAEVQLPGDCVLFAMI